MANDRASRPEFLFGPPVLALSPSGRRAVVVWLPEGEFTLKARVLDIGLFQDGFESGDTAAWSVTVP